MNEPAITEQRVALSLTLITALDPTAVLADAMRLLGGDHDIESGHVHSFDLDDEAEPSVYLVIDHACSGISAVFVDDPVAADEHAQQIRGVVAEIPIINDCRGDHTE